MLNTKEGKPIEEDQYSNQKRKTRESHWKREGILQTEKAIEKERPNLYCCQKQWKGSYSFHGISKYQFVELVFLNSSICAKTLWFLRLSHFYTCKEDKNTRISAAFIIDFFIYWLSSESRSWIDCNQHHKKWIDILWSISCSAALILFFSFFDKLVCRKPAAP